MGSMDASDVGFGDGSLEASLPAVAGFHDGTLDASLPAVVGAKLGSSIFASLAVKSWHRFPVAIVENSHAASMHSAGSRLPQPLLVQQLAQQSPPS